MVRADPSSLLLSDLRTSRAGMKHSRSDAEPDGLSEEVAGLPALGPERLKERWRTLYGTEPPPRISEDLLRRAIAYRLQERALGGPVTEAGSP